MLQFRFLRSLLLVHGRYAYKRMALFCYYMFYKNVANVLVMYFYTMLAKASGERIFLAICALSRLHVTGASRALHKH